MGSLPIAALFAVDEDRPEHAIELYGLAQQFGYVTNSRWVEDVSGSELEGV